MTTPTPQSERRRAARAQASFPVQVSSSGRAEAALLRDISEIGLACTSPQAIPEMTMIGLDFSLPGASDKHQVKGAVVRCEPMPKGENGARRWDLAVFFTDMQPATRAALRHYVAKGKKV